MISVKLVISIIYFISVGIGGFVVEFPRFVEGSTFSGILDMQLSVSFGLDMKTKVRSVRSSYHVSDLLSTASI